MNFLSYFSYVRGASSLAGAFMLALVIWFYGPAIKVDRYVPLERADVRIAVILVLALVVLGVVIVRYVRRRRRAKALEAAITAPQADDGEVLTERMRDAMVTLRKSKGGRSDYLYSIPWYIIIGPPGAGKTTALVNSGLKFPLMASAGGKAGKGVVEGIGGTRYCDWWFAEDAVLIDTAGRYTTQDSGTEGEGEPNLDRKSWFGFLDLLRKNRARQPINGVIVAIGIDDLVGAPEAERNAHADAVRSRLVELHDRLKIAFPVYVVLTKMDLIEGFAEFFGDLREKERKIVWGATFQTEDRTKNTVTEVPAELDALILRLSENLLDRLQSEPNQARRSLILGFPAQFNALRDPVVTFLSRVFEPTRYHSNAILRGFYFTSGTQEGTTLDQLIGATSRAAGSAPASRLSGQGRSYFIHDLLTRVIFGEAGWVSTNRAALRRARLLRGAGLAAVTLVVGLSLAALGVSFAANRSLIADSDRAVEEYRVGAAQMLGEVEVRSPDLADAHTLLLWPLRTFPVGYASREEKAPTAEGFGLGQRGRLLAAADEAYYRALERTFRSRLILRVEEVLQANLDDPRSTYETLKVYRMLTGDRPDNAIIAAWVVRDWEENVYAGRLNEGGRVALRAHLDALLELDAGRTVLVGANAPLISDAERVLARVPLADLAYARLKQDAAATEGLFDWVLVDKAGADADEVFQTVDGRPLAAVTVPGFLTAAGFDRAFLDRLVTIEDEIAAEEWLLGPAAKQPGIQDQYGTLKQDLLTRYHAEAIAAWNGVLAAVALRPMTADKPRYIALRALSSPASPLRQLLRSVVDETSLTKGKAAPAAAAAEGQPDGAAPLTIAAELDSRNVVRDAVRAEPGAAVEAAFTPLHELMAEGADPSLDPVVAALSEIHDRLVNLADLTAASPEATGAVNVKVAAVRADAARLPEPASRLVVEAVDDIDADLRGTRLSQAAQFFNQSVTQPCEAIVANRYPFFRDSDRDAGLEEFTKLFGPAGLLASYRTANLDPYIDMSGPAWRWRPTVKLSDDTLAEFERAAAITGAFFTENKPTPNFDLVISTLSLDPSAISGILRVNRNFIHATSIVRSVPLKWPGETPDNFAAVAVTFGEEARTERIQRSGPWALFRIMDAGRAVTQGDRLVVDFTIAGKRLSFGVEASTGRNPLTLDALSAFRCPASL